jgi:hypothetical protein
LPIGDSGAINTIDLIWHIRYIFEHSSLLAPGCAVAVPCVKSSLFS